jgi:hypothetical protein
MIEEEIVEGIAQAALAVSGAISAPELVAAGDSMAHARCTRQHALTAVRNVKSLSSPQKASQCIAEDAILSTGLRGSKTTNFYQCLPHRDASCGDGGLLIFDF